MPGTEPAFCFAEIRNSSDTVLPFLPELLRISPQLGIVAVLPPNEPDLILRSLRMGACDFLISPITPEQVDAVVQKLLRPFPECAPKASRGHVYSVIPVKGASGATTIACGLAYQFRKNRNQRVLLADLDPLTGVVSFLLKVESHFSFADVLQRASDFDEDLWKATITKREGVDILLAPEMPPGGDVELSDAFSILNHARNSYQVVVADVGTAYSDWALSIVACSDEVLLVTSNELCSLQAAQRVVGYLEANGAPRAKLNLVINQYDPNLGLRPEVIESTLGLAVKQVIPRDYEALRDALLNDKLIAPSSRFGKAMAELARKLEPPTPAPARRPATIAGLLSLFSRVSSG